MDPELRDRYDKVMDRIANACAKVGRHPSSVRLVVVTKTHGASVLQSVIDLGIKDLGENRVQEIEEKVPQLRGEFCMHLIGHLQTNKIAKVLPYAQWIESIDSERLLDKVDEKAGELGKRPTILVQVNTSGEQSKSGCAPDEAIDLCQRAQACVNLDFRGLMTIGPLGANEVQTRKSFELLRKIGDKLSVSSPDLSMGMSGDFEWAIEEGSTIVRIGSLLLERARKQPEG